MSPPPFRAEHIGSLLRPAALIEVRRRHDAGRASSAELHIAEDNAIKDAIALQSRVGLQVVTDGEYRRHAYNDYFYEHLGNVTIAAPPVDEADAINGAKRAAQPMSVVKSPIRWTAPVHASEVAYLQANSAAMPKLTLPGLCALHFRGGTPEILRYGAYQDVDTFWQDVIDAYILELEALAMAGCTYVQLDETAFAKFADPEVQLALAARGDDWRDLIDTYISKTNAVLARAPKSMRIGMHLCRGNRGGHFHAEGSYDVVADKLFNALDISFYFLEYDSPRAGDFSPLRHVPNHKSIVLGLVSTKSSYMEDINTLRRRIEDASRYVDINRLAISPQCGFASVETGNPITPAIQEAKLRLVVEVARTTWGEP